MAAMDNELVVLTLKVANAHVDMGLFQGDELLGTWEVSGHASLTANEAEQAIFSFLDLRDLPTPEDAILCSVVPAVTYSWAQAARAVTGKRPLVVGPGLKTGIAMGYKDPAQIGADRVANAVAVRELYGAPAIAVDFGTATNLEVVGKNGTFLGGTISLGVGSSMRALAALAAQVPNVPLRAPHTVVARTTGEAVQAGTVIGEVKRVEGLIEAIWDELGYKTALIATGPYAKLICNASDLEFVYDETLTLKGLRTLLHMNRK
jgi:type III pantothenate kinase